MTSLHASFSQKTLFDLTLTLLNAQYDLGISGMSSEIFVSTPSKIELDIFNTALTRALSLKMLNFYLDLDLSRDLILEMLGIF